MALPQKVIEQLGREPPKTPGWSGQLLIFSSTVFFISVFIYLGLSFGYKSYLDKGVQSLNNQIQAFSQQIPLDEQAKLISFYSQLANIRTLLANHAISSRVFSWIEKNTQGNVYYDNFSVDIDAGQITVSVRAKTMPDAMQQLAIFENLPEVKSLSVGSLNFSDNSWQFQIVITLTPNYFDYSNIVASQVSASSTGATSQN